MKIKLWQWEFDFDKDDAKILIPLALLLLGLIYTQIKKDTLWAGAVAYYFMYFFLKQIFVTLRAYLTVLRSWFLARCPYCKSRELILQGYQGYHSDEHYAYHLCNHCNKTSVLVNRRLLKVE